MTTEHEPPAATESDAMWHQILMSGHRPLRITQFCLRSLPSSPRCKVCYGPFGGIGGRIVRIAGFGASRKNPQLCNRCLEGLPEGGAEVDIAVLFADIRGSTALGERVGATAFAATMNRFYRTATEILVKHDALIDKLVGDEVMALFVPGFAGPRYRERAVEAGRALLTALEDPEGKGTEVGLGIHAGLAYVGNVGGEGVRDVTALGDTVNVAARLRSAAEPGEMVISESLWESLGDSRPEGAEARTIPLRGKAEELAVRVVMARERAKA
jgi:class 3 adenylate cyclase